LSHTDVINDAAVPDVSAQDQVIGLLFTPRRF
jgi:hypothetical protein